jgi:hypothetical protein
MPFYIRVTSLITPVHCITQTEEPNVFRFIQQTLINKLMAKLLVVLELESTLIMTLAHLDDLPIDYN